MRQDGGRKGRQCMDAGRNIWERLKGGMEQRNEVREEEERKKLHCRKSGKHRMARYVGGGKRGKEGRNGDSKKKKRQMMSEYEERE